MKNKASIPMIQETRIYPLHENSEQIGALIIIRDMAELEREFNRLTQEIKKEVVVIENLGKRLLKL